jgi:hypothetical protein
VSVAAGRFISEQMHEHRHTDFRFKRSVSKKGR